MNPGRLTSGRRTATLVAAVAAVSALSACSLVAQPPKPTNGGGPIDRSATPAGTFTPAATPTVIDPGAHDQPSTGGVKLAPTASGPLDGKVIAIDPGHNTKWKTSINMKSVKYFGAGWRPCQNLGSTALDKTTLEADLVWDLANRIVPMLRTQGATVVLTRPDNEGIGPCNDERALIANRAKADLLISIHGDGNTVATNRGFFVIYSDTMQGGSEIAAKSKLAAKTLVAAVEARSQIPKTNYIGNGSGIYLRGNELGVLNTMETGPAVLIEVGNIIQRDDWAILSSEQGKDALASGIASGASDIVLGAGAMASSASPSPSATPTK